METKENREWMEFVERELGQFHEFRKETTVRMDTLEYNLIRNTKVTTETLDAVNSVKPMLQSLSEAVPLFDDLGGAARILNRVAKLLKPLAIIGAVFAAIVYYLKTGVWEWPKL